MPTRQVTPATVTGPIPVATPGLSYCTHAVRPPTAIPAPARGLPATITIDETAHWNDQQPDPDNEPF